MLPKLSNQFPRPSQGKRFENRLVLPCSTFVSVYLFKSWDKNEQENKREDWLRLERPVTSLDIGGKKLCDRLKERFETILLFNNVGKQPQTQNVCDLFVGTAFSNENQNETFTRFFALVAQSTPSKSHQVQRAKSRYKESHWTYSVVSF